MPDKHPVNVLCMKWGTLYGPEYVNRLYGMVYRNLLRPFRFVCLTDDETGVRKEVECVPIPELGVDHPWSNLPWRKLVLYQRELAGLRGTALYLDLDVVVVGPLDPFFEHPGEFCIIHNWTHPRRMVGNSSVFRFEIGTLGVVLDLYNTASTQHWINLYGNSQTFLSHALGRERMTYWPPGWCVSFKRHCLPRWPLNFVRTAHIPANAHIVVFHGNPRPHAALVGEWPARGHKRLYKRVRPVWWLRDYWRE